jgi:ferredoxin-NADP reductase
MQARFTKLVWENEARTIGTIYCMPDKPYYFTAGQYGDIGVPHDFPDKRGMTRTMTYSSIPSDKQLAFTTKFGRNISTYKQALLNLRPDAPINLTDAMGDLVLPLDASIPLVFVAGGLGIASYVSMIRWLTEQQDSRDVTLLYAIRSIGDVIFQEEFDAYAKVGSVRKILYTTDNKVDTLLWAGEIKKMRLTSAEIMKHAGSDAQIYISGAEHMVNQLQQELQHEYKVPQYRVAFDYYEGYPEL